ncbi:MAG: hypothetical protein U9O94_10950, partial [Nanoarchaeota archaeon]|nr:hypothetical protein [Nanoarchaeota archaeon]
DAPKVHVISATSGAGGSLTGCEVIQGSKTVTYTGGTLPTVGNVYVFDGVTGTPYRDELTSIYQAVSVDTVNGTITLDREYQNADQTGLSVAIIADTSLHAYGLMIEGTLQSFTLGRGGDLKMDFYTGLKNFGDTTLTDSGTGFDMIFSNGRYEKVAVDEWMYQGNAGRNSDQSREFQNASKASIVDHGYGSIEIESETSERISTVESNGQPINTTIYLDRSTYQDIEDDAVGCQFGDNIITGTGADTVDSTGVGSVVNVLNAFMVAHGIIATGLNATANEGCSLAGDGDFTAGVDF